MNYKVLIVISCVAVAFGIHVFTLYMLHGLSISYSSYGKAFIENQFKDSDATNLQEVQEKNEHLAQIFNNIQSIPEEKPTDFKPEYTFQLPQEELIQSNLLEGNRETLLTELQSLETVPTGNVVDFHVEERKLQSLSSASSSNQGQGEPKVASSQDFHVEVEYTPIKDEDGYLFCLKLIPQTDVNFKRIRQNVFFLIDRSYSIDRERYELTKQAVLDVLPLLHQDDTFNLLVFDNKVVKLSEQNLPCNQINFQQAAEFLQKQQHGGFLATTDLYSSLGDIIPEVVADTEVNTAILLSDGVTYLSQDSQRKAISKWTNKNGGKISLFSVAVGKGNNLPLLDLLSSFNKGVLQHAPESEEIKNALRHVMKSIQNPIGKEFSVFTVLPNSTTKVAIYPSSSRLPHLYHETVYRIYGTTNQLDDFYLFLQGKYYDRHVDIKQKISFSNAKKVPRNALEKNLAIQKSYEAYSGYLEQGKRDYLIQAKHLLIPYNIPMAFE